MLRRKARRLLPLTRKRLRWVGVALCSACLVLGLSLGQRPAHSTLLANQLTSSTPAASSQRFANNPAQLVEQGKAFYQGGQYAAAAEAWSQAAQGYKSQPLNQAIVLNQLSLAQQELGQWLKAQDSLRQSLEIVGAPPAPENLSIYAQALNAQGSLNLSQGDPKSAMDTWGETAEIYAQLGDEIGRIGSLINQAQAQQVMGLYLKSRKTLEKVTAELDQQANPEIRATGYRSLGNVLRLVGDLEEAERSLLLSLQNAEVTDAPQEVSMTQLSLGNTARARKSFDLAIDYYQKASQSPIPSTQQQARLNLLSVLIEKQDWPQAQQLWPQIDTELSGQPPSRRNIYSKVNLVKSLVKLNQESPSKTPSIPDIANITAKAVQQSYDIDDPRAQAYALGNLGNLYELDEQWSEARKLTEQALFIAQANNASEISYQWQWQLGRIMDAQKQTEQATSAYQGAYQTLEYLRKDLVATNPEAQFSFRESVEPVYRELVDLLLRGDNPSQENLNQARAVMESLQLTELDNFFRSACLDGQIISIEDIDQQSAAVVYPILLKDRIELITSLPQQKDLKHQSIPIPQAEVEKTIQLFREEIEKPYTFIESKELGQIVYNWLIQPLQSGLEESQADTLVFVLDGALRNLPLAALYDSENYLIEKYALALAPGMQLINTEPLQGRELQVIAAGISEARGFYPPLENVKKELDKISRLVTSTVLLNRDFTSTSLREQIQSLPYPIVHLATHGKFSSEAEKTILLAWDKEINVNQLNELLRSSEQVRPEPIELLVLSACETAAGDDRAALGLAGVSVQAGARSTLASLWSLDDESTASLIGEFYDELVQSKVSKAKALQKAQVAMIQDPDFRHPAHWSAFVLVGNWL
ncbi:CHAT domain-containing protein [Acaryochloris sp. 'Moss Beach']|uniref:CHAT domain-containing protein n=1 Tax=Acaryochloris sp. 'Moss Beach' TaxID=2740837 RepID=UPI001F2A5EB8|nr:CHAT domain-containing protein [Acaryochloris sp. 'Moss Beach']UJB68963.1 CHAT domain-containing protein [Acaryochloris sp. 'Moss Beach']